MPSFDFYRVSGTAPWEWRRVDRPGGAALDQSVGWKDSGWQAAASKNKRQITPIADQLASGEVPGVTTGTVRVIGTDFGSLPVPALSWFQSARASGYEGAWVPTGSWNPARGSFWWQTKNVLSLYEQAGFKYLFTYHRPNALVLEAWKALGAEWQGKIKAFCFDVEDPGEPLRPADVDAVAAQMEADGQNPTKKLWLYSAKYVWANVQGFDDQRFAGRFQHIAPYAGRKDGWPDTIPAIELWGGFTQAQVDGLQLRGAEAADIVTFQGVGIHESIFDRATLDAI